MIHPLSPMIPEMIAKVGVNEAVKWWLKFAMECPDALADCLDAIDAMVKGDIDRLIMDEDGEGVARAFQLVRVFELDLFVEATRTAC